MMKFKVVKGKIYGDIGFNGESLVIKKGIWVSKIAVAQLTGIYQMVLEDKDVTHGVISVESEMVDKTLAVYLIYGATGDNGKDY